ncbi:hypothetical protein, partial [Devosia ureilytica]
MNATTKIRLQVLAGLARSLVVAKLLGPFKRQGRAAQAKTLLAIGGKSDVVHAAPVAVISGSNGSQDKQKPPLFGRGLFVIWF